MKKPLKVMSAASLAAMMSVSVLTPVMAADLNEKQQNEFSVVEYAVVKEGKILKVSVDVYREHILEEDVEAVEVYGTGTGNYYDLKTFREYLIELDSLEETIKALDKAGVALKEEAVDAKIEQGLFVPKDEQPEDRLNETFFYNVA